MRRLITLVPALHLAFGLSAAAQVSNLRIVTDASPDYHDMEGFIRSATSRWETPEEKCWAVFYWNHIGRRQTSPMILHGLELSDPIRQLNDYGYTMCSTVAGINCSIWDAMGLPVKYWDITLHTVSEVEYGGRWHVYDNSMSAIYTLCDGKTIAGVEDVGKEGACEASGGKMEPGHIARYHCLTATSKNGFLTGADCARDLAQEYRCFNPNGLKHRFYFRAWDRGHRYILNLREGEATTRHYESLGGTREYYVPNQGEDPEKTNTRYRIRGNGIRTFRPGLAKGSVERVAHALSGVRALEPGGLAPSRPGEPGEAIFKVEGSNVMTCLKIKAAFFRRSEADSNSLQVSTTNGLRWKEVWKSEATGRSAADVQLVDDVNGSYEVLVKAALMGRESATDAVLEKIEFEAITMLNSKTQPRLNLGKNTVHVGAGDPLESIVLWPELQGGKYEPFAVEEANVAAEAEHPGYQGVLHAREGGKDAWVIFKIDAPRAIRKVTYGGRLYNRVPKSAIRFLHSFDGGSTWTESYALKSTEPPWDVIHHEEVTRVPPDVRSVLFKYVLSGPTAGKDACSIYSVRMEALHEPADPSFHPLEVTFHWREVGVDRSLVERSHTEFVTKLPHVYNINVGGADHPVMDWLRVNVHGAVPDARHGYSDGKDVGGHRYIPRWVTYGKNLAEGKPYVVSVPSRTDWDAGDLEGKKLTDGIVGPPYAGGTGPSFALCWAEGTRPVVTVDLGKPESCAAFRIHVSGGWPWWDALKGEVKDQVEVETSSDGSSYSSQGSFQMNLRWKDIPANHMMPDDETATGPTYCLVPPAPVRARYVRFNILPARILTVSEVEVLDSIRDEPFDLRVALPRP